MIPILVLALPIFDTSLVFFSRLRRGKNPLTTAGKDHVSHRLAHRTGSQREAVLLCYLITGGTGLASSFLTQANLQEAIIVGSAALLLGMFAMWKTRVPEKLKGEVTSTRCLPSRYNLKRSPFCSLSPNVSAPQLKIPPDTKRVPQIKRLPASVGRLEIVFQTTSQVSSSVLQFRQSASSRLWRSASHPVPPPPRLLKNLRRLQRALRLPSNPPTATACTMQVPT